MKAFGFHVIKADGKEEESLSNAIDEAKAMENSAVCIVMDTIKAQGIPYYYTRSDNHAPKFDEEADREINAVVKQLETFIENGGT